MKALYERQFSKYWVVTMRYGRPSTEKRLFKISQSDPISRSQPLIFPGFQHLSVRPIGGILDQEAQIPFSVGEGPLVRVKLLKIEDKYNGYYLRHIISCATGGRPTSCSTKGLGSIRAGGTSVNSPWNSTGSSAQRARSAATYSRSARRAGRRSRPRRRTRGAPTPTRARRRAGRGTARPPSRAAWPGSPPACTGRSARRDAQPRLLGDGRGEPEGDDGVEHRAVLRAVVLLRGNEHALEGPQRSVAELLRTSGDRRGDRARGGPAAGDGEAEAEDEVAAKVRHAGRHGPMR